MVLRIDVPLPRMGILLSATTRNRIDRIVSWGEARLGPALWTTVAVGSLMVAAAIYVRPAIRCGALGAMYARMATAPFAADPENLVAFRVLTPLLSYLVGLRGDLIIITNLTMAAALLACVYVWFRRHSPQPGDALLATIVIAFSLVTLTTIYHGGYTDSTTYLLVFCMWWLRRRRVLFYALLFVALLNHESVAVLIPWFVFLSYTESPSRRRWLADTVVGLGIVFAAFAGYRAWMLSRMEIQFTTGHYLRPLLEDPLHWFRRSSPYQLLGLFTVFKLAWIFPIIAIVSHGRRREWHAIVSMVLILGGAFMMLFVAYDSSRMFTLAFPVMILALKHIVVVNPFGARRWMSAVIVLNLLVPPWFTAADKVEIMHSTVAKLLERM